MKNPNYSYTGMAITVAARAETLSELDARLSKLAGQLDDPNDAYFPWAHDHADEVLANTAKQLRELAEQLESLRAYTNYPPQTPLLP